MIGLWITGILGAGYLLLVAAEAVLARAERARQAFPLPRPDGKHPSPARAGMRKNMPPPGTGAGPSRFGSRSGRRGQAVRQFSETY